MSSGPEHRGRCRLTLTIIVVHFSFRQIPSGDDQLRRAILFRWPLEIVCDRCSPHHGGKSANPSWLYSGPGREPSLSASGRPPRARRTHSPRWNAPALPCFAPGSAARSIFDGRLIASSLKGFWISTVAARCPPGRQGRAPARGMSYHAAFQSVGTPRRCRAHRHEPGRLPAGNHRLRAAGNRRVRCRALVVPPRPRLATEALSERECATAGDPLDGPRPISALTADGVKLAGTWHPAARGDAGRTAPLLHGFAEASGAAASAGSRSDPMPPDPMPPRRNTSLLPPGLGWPTTPPLHGSTLMTLQPLLKRLITHHPFRTPDRLLLWILVREELTPTLLAAAVVSAPFQVERVFRQ